MKRKLIEMEQEFTIMCDNKQCDYKIENPSRDPNVDLKEFLNKPCPQCGENLLTQNDYLLSLKVLKTVNWINKWFSWLVIFPIKTKPKDSIIVHCHNGLNVIKEK